MSFCWFLLVTKLSLASLGGSFAQVTAAPARSEPGQALQPPEGREGGREFPIPKGCRERRSCGESRKSIGVSRQEREQHCEVGERTRTGRVWRRVAGEKAERWPS